MTSTIHPLPTGPNSGIVSDVWPAFTATHHKPCIQARQTIVTAPGVITIPFAGAAEVIYEVDGQGETAMTLSPGSVLIGGASPVKWVRWENPGDCLRIELSEDVLDRLQDSGWMEHKDVQVVHDQVLHQIGSLLLSSLGEQCANGCVFAESLGSMLIAHIDRHYGPESNLPNSAAGERLSPGVLRRIRDVIERRIADPLKISELAATAHLSPFHFTRAFKGSTGMSPHQYITARRMERAKVWLRTTHLPVGDVAWRVGFSNTSHFNAQFRRHTGVTPGVFRTAA